MSTVLIPRLKCTVPSEAVDLSIMYAVQKLGYDRASPEQGKAIQEFLLGRDVFVSLPTGEGKSLCYASLPLVFDWIKERHVRKTTSENPSSSIVLVVSPLTALMKDQVESFSKRGLRCAFVGVEQHDEAVKQAVVSGEYQLVYMSPESLLGVLQWREMFRSVVYQECLVAIAVDEAHLVEKWGASFREEFAHLSEVRSIVPKDVNLIALTATASLITKKVILKSLCMDTEKTFILTKVPNKLNICYRVTTKPDEKKDMLMPVVLDIKQNGRSAKKTLIICRTYQECIDIFVELVTELDSEDALFVPSLSTGDDREHVCQLYTACTAEDTKDYILKSFTSHTGAVRVVVATIAFGLGLDAPDIRQIFHWGPSSNIEAYVQETGRSGRDGLQSTAVLFLRPSDQQATDEATEQPMQVYCRNSSICRRQLLMSEFTAEAIEQPSPLHNCCDVCQQRCRCEACECIAALSSLPEVMETNTIDNEQVQLLDPQKRQQLHAELCAYRESLCQEATNVSGQAIPLLFGVEIATGLTDNLIEKIIIRSHSMDSVSQLLSLGVTSVAQAKAILHIIFSVR